MTALLHIVLTVTTLYWIIGFFVCYLVAILLTRLFIPHGYPPVVARWTCWVAFTIWLVAFDPLFKVGMPFSLIPLVCALALGVILLISRRRA